MNEEMFEMAKEYAAKGWRVLCLYGVNDDLSCACRDVNCTDTGKHPVTQRGVKDGTVDLAKLERWFITDPAKETNLLKQPRNVGIVAGEKSGLTILDIDTGHGKVGGQTYAELTAEHGDPPTLRATTGSGGTHLFFQYNSALTTTSNALGKHIDCRNDNGYVVAPPSRHKSGGKYSWENWGDNILPLPRHLTKKKDTRGRPHADDPYKRKYTLGEVQTMLKYVSSESRDDWRRVGIVLGRIFDRSDPAWLVYNTWSDTWKGQKGRGHHDIMRQAFYDLSQQQAEQELSIGTIIRLALDGGWAPTTGDAAKEDFIFYAPGEGNFLYRETLDKWKAASVDLTVSPINLDGKVMKASDWLKANRRATSLAHDPSIQEEFVLGVNCVNGELVPRVGAAVFNTYRRPTIPLGDADMAEPFVTHCQRLFNKPGDCDQFLSYLAHRTQRPGEKPRFALMLTGEQGTGKDTAVEFCLPAIGSWNVAPIDPAALTTGFNEYAAATLIRISETANLQDMNKWALNESLKVLIAGSPDFCTINPKFGHKYTVRLHCGLIITSNHLLSSIFIPPDDRRYDIIEAATLAEMGLKPSDEEIATAGEDEERVKALGEHYATTRRDYFTGLWEWFHEKGGARHVAAYLHERQLSGFSAALGQRRTLAHQEVVRSGMVGDEWLRDIVDGLVKQEVLNGNWILERAIGMGERRETARVRMGHALRRMGYEALDNPHYKDGRWKLNGVLCRIYKKRGFKIQGHWQDHLELQSSNCSSAEDKSHGK